jgi:dolichol-phosphate mannosyltransferase
MITVLVPAYNEEDVIGEFISVFTRESALKEYELLIVNDGSTDKTHDIVIECQKQDDRIRIIDHSVNMGLGAAISTGFKNCQGDVVITMDSDLTHNPDDLKNLLSGIEGYDVCIGSRYAPGGRMENVPGWRVALSVLANKIFQFIFFTKARDITSGFKAYRASCVKDIEIKSKGFSVQLEIMVHLIRAKAKMNEVPIILKTRGTGRGSSKFSFFRMLPGYSMEIMRLVFVRWF